MNKSPEVRLLVVQLWSPASEVTFYTGSHLHALDAQQAPNGVLWIPQERLNLPGVTEKKEEMLGGGL